MFRTTLRNLAARKLRLLSTGLAIVLGVAFMAGTLVLTDTIRQTFDGLFADADDGVDAYVRSSTLTGEGTMNEQRSRLDDSVVDDIASLDGVLATAPVVQGYAQLLDADGAPLGDPMNGPPTLAGNWIAETGLNPFTLAAGRAPRRG